ncbi:MAG TPA: DUF2062 domain-containing protein [Opitutaceae bacterium]|nr:DUF2062 domain-containing protein [Opitutaceae bacterium]
MTENPTPTDAEPPRTSWQRHVIDPIAAQLTQGITPEKIALTLAVGSAFALFPILGTTTILCLIVGIVLRLNQPIIQIVNALCTPLHLPVIYGMVRLGSFIFNIPYSHVGIRMMNHMLWDDPRDFFERFGITALHAIAAWATIAPFWMIIVYLLALPVLREVLHRRTVLQQATVQDPPPEHPVP